VTPLPDGFSLVLDRSLRTFRRGTVLVGGYPGRLITLSRQGADGLDELLGDGPTTPAVRRLGRRLVDAGMAHPRPRPGSTVSGPGPSVTVVVPARDRAGDLDRCLASLGPGLSVVVVDDASDDPAAVADVCRKRGARVITRAINGGPAVARNDALAVVDTELVAFVDSDCTVTDGWLTGLVWLFEDAAIDAVAPRIRPARSDRDPGSPALVGYNEARSALDLGEEPGEVGPERQVRYVPTAVLVARRSALAAGFDTDLRVGEDVDLVWRLTEGGRRVRYEPSVTVHHREPTSWSALLARRYRYGTSAAPLAQRHPGALAPVELRPWPTVVVAILLSGRPRTALCLVGAAAAVLGLRVRRRGIPAWLAVRWSAQSVWWTAIGVGRAATVVAGPVAIVATVRGRWRTAATLLVLAPPAVEWWRRRPTLDPVRWSLASIADDVAYGAGVWTGCLRSGTFGPLTPAVRFGRGEGSASSDGTADEDSGVTMSGGASTGRSAD
jgi:mycofactocin system glycosyltransferase